MGERTVSDSFFLGEVFLLVILLSADWPETSCIGKRRKREKRKKKRKRKKEKERIKGGKQSEHRKQGGVSSDSVYFKSLDFPWNWSVSLVFWERSLLR